MVDFREYLKFYLVSLIMKQGKSTIISSLMGSTTDIL